MVRSYVNGIARPSAFQSAVPRFTGAVGVGLVIHDIDRLVEFSIEHELNVRGIREITDLGADSCRVDTVVLGLRGKHTVVVEGDGATGFDHNAFAVNDGTDSIVGDIHAIGDVDGDVLKVVRVGDGDRSGHGPVRSV